jgi:nucleoside-diphosphate-sugar epimerase
MKVLYIGGTGEISTSCVSASIAKGHEVTVFNRGHSETRLPPEAIHVKGDLRDAAPYEPLKNQQFDVICQFLAFTPETIERDIDFFSGRCGQYIFISTASAYQKTERLERITESTPLDNPYWAYSRAKAACEGLLQEASIPATIVRPSHTYRVRVPSTVVDGNHLVWRLSRGKPVIVHDNGESLWTLTHAEDFARAFVQLHGNEAALNEVFHITSEDAHSWRNILQMVAAALDCDADLRFIGSSRLISHIPALEGPLLGDKANNMILDNSRIRSVTNGWQCRIELEDGIAQTVDLAREKLAAGYTPDLQLDEMVDQILEAEVA